MRGDRWIYTAWRNICMAVGGLFILSIYMRAGTPAALIPICALQGNGFTSPYVGQQVRTRGVVTLDKDDAWQRGFYIQAANCDGDNSTSDGIFVYTGESTNLVDAKDLVEVTGSVGEYYGLSEIIAVPGNIQILSKNNTLPVAKSLSPPAEEDEARVYYETLEGMRVKLLTGIVVGPTDSDDRTWLVDSNLGIERVFQDQPGGTGMVICVDDGGLFEITPEASVGMHASSLIGVLDFRYSKYCIELTSAPSLARTSNSSMESMEDATSQDYPVFNLATFNLANMFDTVNDPLTDDRVYNETDYVLYLQKRAMVIHDELQEPGVIVFQEAENLQVLADLAARPEITADYAILLENGPDRRGLDLGMLYRVDQAQLIDYETRQGCTDLQDGLGPDGNRDVQNPINAITCDQNSDGVLDGNRLFSRPPMITHLRLCWPDCLDNRATESAIIELFVIANHWKSKTEDSTTFQYTLQRRIQQAEFVADLVQEIRLTHPGANIIVMGDLNDNPASQPLAVLKTSGLSSRAAGMEKRLRYTYIYQGLSQEMDYILTALQPSLAPVSIIAAHVNADYPYDWYSNPQSVYRSSDHDPLVISLGLFNQLYVLPTVFR